jgi:hypothetical protein
MALAAILCARARIVNSLLPKMWASSVVARLAASSLISASTASRIALTRSSTSACFSDDRGVDGMMDSASRTRFSSTRPAIPLVYKNSTNFQDAHRQFSGERHNSWWIGCSLSSLSHNQTEPLGDLWRNEN